ncbi:hypothetical protein GCM10018793_15560 [Streptomyces sulfonofaciens]|uniref:Uncharacterized protein n=1 Tax=Streptomyces sulfonofaciens TaxID=68272 RepID=A0A919FXP7_9ACTN|nr:hypothetical protein [Streptomyces sulfonofaciens]GHH74417.1 hypothetical protein GCM10018793_15560 [Streptomyces sulfonofaciens]
MTDTTGRDHGASGTGAGTGTGLAGLRGDCARMVPHWVTPPPAAPGPVPPSRIHPIVVPPGSARLLDAMSDYGD